MKLKRNLMRNLTISLGIISSLWYLGNYFIFELLRPKMVAFETISAFEEGLLNYVGIGWLMMTGFLILSFYRMLTYLKNKIKISKFNLLLLAGIVTSLLFIFSDLALINDIGKQYKHGLSQPEWVILYIVTFCQLIAALLLTYANIFIFKRKGEKFIAKDVTVFTLAQYIGAICGLFGVVLISSNFNFLRPLWMIKYQVAATSIFLIFPYVLIVGYWLWIKFKEKSKQIYDEKQIQDICLSSLITLIMSLLIMGLVFSLNFGNLSGILSVIWFPLYAFLVLFLFSSINLFLNRESVS